MVISRLIPGNFLDIGPIFVDTDPAGYETGRELGMGRGDERIDPIFSISRIIYHDCLHFPGEIHSDLSAVEKKEKKNASIHSFIHSWFIGQKTCMAATRG